MKDDNITTVLMVIEALLFAALVAIAAGDWRWAAPAWMLGFWLSRIAVK